MGTSGEEIDDGDVEAMAMASCLIGFAVNPTELTLVPAFAWVFFFFPSKIPVVNTAPFFEYGHWIVDWAINELLCFL